MNKGLDALENIKGNCDLFDEGYQWDNEFSKQFDLDIDTLEQELKRLEKFDNIEYSALIESHKKLLKEKKVNKKKLKAFEIIKNNIKITEQRQVQHKNLWKLSQKDYDLLKEMGL